MIPKLGFQPTDMLSDFYILTRNATLNGTIMIGRVSVYEMGGDRERKRGLSLSCKAMGMGLREREGKRSMICGGCIDVEKNGFL